jgi:hypothetical protein
LYGDFQDFSLSFENTRRILFREGQPTPGKEASMRYGYSAQLREDLNSRVLAALRSHGMVNIALVAEEVRLRNLDENLALEDVELLVMQVAQLYGAAMELDGLAAVEAARFTSLPDIRRELSGIDSLG